MAWEWLTGAAGLVSGVTGAIFGSKDNKSTNRTNLQIAREANELDDRHFQQSIAQQWNMWRAQNQYNDPKMQAARLRAAGFNPQNIMNGDGATGNAGSMTAPSANPAHTAMMQPYDSSHNFAQIGQGVADAVNSYYQNQLAQANAQKAREEANDVQITRALRMSQMKADTYKMMKDAHASEWQKRLARQQFEFLERTEHDRVMQTFYDSQQSKEMVNNVRASTQLQEENTLVSQLSRVLNIRADERAERELRSIISKFSAETQELLSRANLNSANAGYVKAQEKELFDLLPQKYTNMLLNNRVLRQDANFGKDEQPWLLKSLRYHVWQQQQDYRNPANVVGKLVGAGGLPAVIKSVR